MEIASPYIRRVFLSDPERLIEAVQGAEAVPCQLSRCSHVSELGRVLLPESCLDLASFGPSMLFTGQMPRDCYTLVFVLACPQRGKVFNFSVEHIDGFLGFFPPGCELDALTPEGYANATLTVASDRFLGELARLFPDFPEVLLKKGGAMRIPEPEQREIRRIVADLRALDEEGAETFARETARQALETDFLVAFLTALQAGSDQLAPGPTQRLVRRQQRFREVRDYLASQAPDEVSLSQLAEASGLSARGLENLFRDHLGVPPLIYLRHRRLHEARRQLLRADQAGDVSVKRVALDQGFWHFGRFSAYYRELFGECPSATIQGARGARSSGHARKAAARDFLGTRLR